jgi:hypothetical protein
MTTDFIFFIVVYYVFKEGCKIHSIEANVLSRVAKREKNQLSVRVIGVCKLYFKGVMQSEEI